MFQSFDLKGLKRKKVTCIFRKLLPREIQSFYENNYLLLAVNRALALHKAVFKIRNLYFIDYKPSLPGRATKSDTSDQKYQLNRLSWLR